MMVIGHVQRTPSSCHQMWVICWTGANMGPGCHGGTGLLHLFVCLFLLLAGLGKSGGAQVEKSPEDE